MITFMDGKVWNFKEEDVERVCFSLFEFKRTGESVVFRTDKYKEGPGEWTIINWNSVMRVKMFGMSQEELIRYGAISERGERVEKVESVGGFREATDVESFMRSMSIRGDEGDKF